MSKLGDDLAEAYVPGAALVGFVFLLYSTFNEGVSLVNIFFLVILFLVALAGLIPFFRPNRLAKMIYFSSVEDIKGLARTSTISGVSLQEIERPSNFSKNLYSQMAGEGINLEIISSLVAGIKKCEINNPKLLIEEYRNKPMKECTLFDEKKMKCFFDLLEESFGKKIPSKFGIKSESTFLDLFKYLSEE